MILIDRMLIDYQSVSDQGRLECPSRSVSELSRIMGILKA